MGHKLNVALSENSEEIQWGVIKYTFVIKKLKHGSCHLENRPLPFGSNEMRRKSGRTSECFGHLTTLLVSVLSVGAKFDLCPVTFFDRTHLPDPVKSAVLFYSFLMS